MPCVWCQREYELVHWDGLPEHLKYNKYIQENYRVDINVKQCLESICHWHNETLNIWTHLGGFLIFAVLLPYSVSTWLIGKDPMGVTFCILYFLSSMFMLGSSTVFHVFSCMSAIMYKRFAKLDYLGIAIQVIGSFGIVCYYLFKCNPIPFGIYFLLVVVLGIAVVVAILITNIHGIGNEKQRLGLFIGFGFSVVICGPQAVIIHGWATVWALLWRILVMGTLYVVGALIYGFQIPERWFQGQWETFPSSHAIWHCFVLGAALFHLYTCFWIVHEPAFSCVV